jgi:iron(III) transport system ATP-binding protein
MSDGMHADARSVQVEDLCAGYGGAPVLRGLDLHVPGGSLACVLGPSGCGKTTLLRVLAGFQAASAGRVRIGGTLVDDGRRAVRAERRRVGYVPQEGALFPHLCVADNVGFSLARMGRGGRGARATRVGELLELVGLAGLEGWHPHQLSGGQQQRVALARALAGNPQLVLLDEPFAALDAALRARLRADVRSILDAAGVTAILVTHDQTEALSMADVVAVIRDGRVVQAGPPAEVYRRPADEHVAAFVGEGTLLPAAVEGGVAVTALGVLELDAASALRSGRALAVVRPEQVRVGPAGAPSIDAPETVLLGRVTSSMYQGHEARIDVIVQTSAGPLSIAARVGGAVALGEGMTVTVSISGPVWAIAAEVRAEGTDPPQHSHELRGHHGHRPVGAHPPESLCWRE